MSMLEQIKLELGLADTTYDSYLTMKIDDASNSIELYTNGNLANIDEDVVNIVIRELVVERFNKRGLEGFGYFSEGGVSYTMAEKESLARLNNYRRPLMVAVTEDEDE